MKSSRIKGSIEIILLTLFFTSISSDAVSFPNVYPRVKLEANPDAGDPLILTPYLNKGDITLAQNLSRVLLTEKLGFESHAGFFTVNETYNSNLYFWYFPPLSKVENTPILLWLQGGPGGSSLFGLFTELGPLKVTSNGFSRRKHTWNLEYHLIFIDNPVGTGFSFTDKDEGYCSDETCIAKGLYSAMQQFYTLFPKLRANKLFITGESYAGKYLPSLGMEIHRQNVKGDKKKINLHGLALGNAYCDPIMQMDYGNYLYQHGLLDNVQLQVFEEMQEKVKTEIRNKNWKNADVIMDKLMDGDLTNTSYFKSYTGFTNYYNFLFANEYIDTASLKALLDSVKVRKLVHVGGLPYHSGENVALHLITDILQSVKDDISELLSHYRLMFYNGQLDIIVAYPLTVNFLSSLDFDSSDKYKTAIRKIWRVDNEIAGYYKRAGNLTEVLVRNAGQMVPADQPKWALDLITRFVRNKI